jgi:hypothetical protein
MVVAARLTCLGRGGVDGWLSFGPKYECECGNWGRCEGEEGLLWEVCTEG